MISEDVTKLCQEFCSENRDVLASHSFCGNSVGCVSVRFIQRVAAEVQVFGSDEKNSKTGECCEENLNCEECAGPLLGSAQDSDVQRVAAGVQASGSNESIKKQRTECNHPGTGVYISPSVPFHNAEV